jgi:hypothetical protein
VGVRAAGKGKREIKKGREGTGRRNRSHAKFLDPSLNALVQELAIDDTSVAEKIFLQQ